MIYPHLHCRCFLRVRVMDSNMRPLPSNLCSSRCRAKGYEARKNFGQKLDSKDNGE
jgi:hypothetical protein